MLVQCLSLKIVKQKRDTYLSRPIRVGGVSGKCRCLIRVGHGYVVFFELTVLPSRSPYSIKIIKN